MAAACPGVDSQVLATILDPFWPIFNDLGPDCLSQCDLNKKHCDIATIETSETSTLCVETRQLSVLATGNMSVVETG